MSKKDYTKMWNKTANKLLLGKKIIKVEYMSSEEADKGMWYSRPVRIILDDGTNILPMSDDEGNDGGSLAYYKGGTTDTLPTLWWQSEEKKTVSIRDVNKEIAKEMNDADKTDKWVKENHQDIISTIGYRGEK